MLWKEISEDGWCDNCPLPKSEICPGRFACYGGEPVEPPCCNFDDDTDLDKWVSDYYERERKTGKNEFGSTGRGNQN